MNLSDRLRGVVNPSRGADLVRSAQASLTRFAPEDDVADVLGGEWREARGQRYLVIDTKFSPGYRHGHTAVADCLPPDDGMWPTLPLLAPALSDVEGAARRGRLVFVDLETTGLAGGAGTCAFLVGCGWFEGANFRVRQFFLASHAAERGLLEGVAELGAGATGIVTYNGKSFDLPLIETRFLFHRMETPFAGVPHVDMLHPARRLWRGDGEEGCRLTSMEETLLGHVREGDVDGFEIPARYFHYVRTSDARPLHAVLEHNRLDLLALAMLTARAAQLLEDGPMAARTPREAFGLGRLYERAGRAGDAKACYAKAADGPAIAGPYREVGATPLSAAASAKADASPELCAEALRAYAMLCRRDRQYVDAATAWRRILALRRCPAQIAREAAEALAVHLEHRERDLGAARRYALQLLQCNISRSRVEAVQYRLARLDRKLGAPAPDAAPLF